jgi:hypothetical protein
VTDNRTDSLAVHLERCCDEYVSDVNGPGIWRHDGEVYEVDQAIEEGPVQMVRKSDGARFEVWVDVAVAEMGDPS